MGFGGLGLRHDGRSDGAGHRPSCRALRSLRVFQVLGRPENPQHLRVEGNVLGVVLMHMRLQRKGGDRCGPIQLARLFETVIARDLKGKPSRPVL